MSEQLVVRLGASKQHPIQWLVWSDSEQDIIASGQLDEAEQLHTLTSRAGERPVVALVPASDISLRWVTLPPKAGRKALAAIPYMLEEEISKDVDSQFFAIGPRMGERQAVAILDKEKMDQWLTQLHDAGLYCDRVIPDVLCLPMTTDGWTILAFEDQLLVRQDQWKGLQGESEWLLPLLVSTAETLEHPISVTNFSEHSLADAPNLRSEQPPAEMPMKVLAEGALKANVNLRQGEFRPKKQSTKRASGWRPVAYLAAAALVLSVTDKAIQAVQLEQQSEQLQRDIRSTFQDAFPEVTRIVNVRAQMNQKMSELEQGGGGVSMLAMLSQLQSAFSAADVRPQTLRFDAKRRELRLQLSASGFEAIERFRNQVQSQGFEVEQGAINNTNERVISSVAIRS